MARRWYTVTVDGVTKYFGIPSPYASDATRNSFLEPYVGSNATGNATLTIPASANTMSFAWESGDWASECSYSVGYTKLDGSSPQTALSESTVSVGTKVLSICQFENCTNYKKGDYLVPFFY